MKYLASERTMANAVFLALLLHLSQAFVQEVKLKDFSKLTSCPGKVLSSSDTYREFEGLSLVKCATMCIEEECKSFQHDRSTLSCRLYSVSDPGDCSMMVDGTGMVYFDKVSQLECFNGGYLRPDGVCACVNGYVGMTCERLMTDCSEGYNAGHGYTSGIFNIKPPGTATSFPVYCFMKHGGRTRILFRSTSLDFYRNWQEYKNGFGAVSGDHWLGLQHIHDITKDSGYELKVELRLKNQSYYQQFYENFKVESEANKFRMTFSVTKPQTSRPLGDCFSPLNGSYFSTLDQDNDNMATGSCAVNYESGWWFNACADCNPTGRLLKPIDSLRTNVPSEVFWTNDLGNTVPAKLKMWLVKFRF